MRILAVVKLPVLGRRRHCSQKILVELQEYVLHGALRMEFVVRSWI